MIWPSPGWRPASFVQIVGFDRRVVVGEYLDGDGWAFRAFVIGGRGDPVWRSELVRAASDLAFDQGMAARRAATMAEDRLGEVSV